jgi:hypothetical protein
VRQARQYALLLSCLSMTSTKVGMGEQLRNLLV